MDMNYLVQRRINARKAYRRKVILTIALSAILLVLFIVGLVKIILDEKETKENSGNKAGSVSENITPGLNGNENGSEASNAGSNGGSAEITPEPTATATPTPTPVPKKLVAIDPGHGGDDLGSTRQGLYEKDANLNIALYLKKELEDAGYSVFLIRDTDVSVENTDRPAAAIAANADIYVSIHLNSLDSESDDTQGAEVWYADKRNDDSDLLARYVVDELCKVIDTRNRGIKMSNNLIVLKYNEMPACLVECGFITSVTERAKLFNPEYQQKIAKGVANGIKEFLPLE